MLWERMSPKRRAFGKVGPETLQAIFATIGGAI